MATRKKKTTPAQTPASPSPGEPAPTAATAVIDITIPVVDGVEPVALAKAANTARALSKTFVDDAYEITVTDEATFLEADAFLGEIREGEKNVENLMEPIIRPIRQGLDKLYELRRTLADPYVLASGMVKSRMSMYKHEERIQLEKRAAEILEKQIAARKKLEAETAPGEQVPNVAFLSPVVAAPVRGRNSRVIVTEKVRVTSLDALLTYMFSDLGANVPLDILEVNQARLTAWLQTEPVEVKKCAGVEVYTDTGIGHK